MPLGISWIWAISSSKSPVVYGYVGWGMMGSLISLRGKEDGKEQAYFLGGRERVEQLWQVPAALEGTAT